MIFLDQNDFFMWWMIWHLRNNIIFGDGKCTIEQSANFIQSYLASFLQISSNNNEPDVKGKKPVALLDDGETKQKKEVKEIWRNPETGWVKLNVDASFIEEDNLGAWGAVLHDKEGVVILSAWGVIPYCNSADIAEAIACLEGLKASMYYVADQLIMLLTSSSNMLYHGS
jgi:hypothetical protein